MKIERFVSPLLDSNMYLISEEGHGILIDPFVTDVRADGLHVDYIFLTHEHYDHISGVNDWKEKTGAVVLCNAVCAENIQDARKNLSHIFPAFCELQMWKKLEKSVEVKDYICRADQTFAGEMELIWQGHRIELFDCPGHSAGSVGILFDRMALFSGDTLMKDAPIACRLPGGSAKAWREASIPRLRKLNGNICVYPGHGEDFLMKDYTFWEEE